MPKAENNNTAINSKIAADGSGTGLSAATPESGSPVMALIVTTDPAAMESNPPVMLVIVTFEEFEPSPTAIVPVPVIVPKSPEPPEEKFKLPSRLMSSAFKVPATCKIEPPAIAALVESVREPAELIETPPLPLNDNESDSCAEIMLTMYGVSTIVWQV